MDKIIDLRSDTLTQATPEMLQAMFAAKVGDDVYGEDETVNRLEAKLATMFGMEAALFCPSGTMSNQIAIKCFTQPLDEVICDQTSHIYRYEGGGIAFNSAASVRLLQGPRGILSPELIEPEINEDNIHFPRTSMVVLENTVNKGGGKCYELKQIEAIHHLCKIKNLKLHLDGARIFNALVAKKEAAASYGEYFDSISVCLSKGLGAPVGSVLLANSTTIKQARRIRKVLGGGMRQVGYLAAAGIYALDHHIERLATDHQHAAVLAKALSELSWVEQVLPPETNIVLFELRKGVAAANVVQILAKKGILCNATSASSIRFVTHLNIDSAQIDKTLEHVKTLKF